jgi:uncharacterized secreted repeat protein (TIGR03808 family)
MRMTRRNFLTATAASLTLAHPAHAALGIDGFRGSIDATQLGVAANAASDQTKVLQNALDRAAAVGNPLFLPPGRYVVNGIELPDGGHIVGVPGATHLVSSRGGPLVTASRAKTASLKGLVLDGQARPLPSGTGLATFTDTARLSIEDCRLTNSPGAALVLERCGGWIENSRIDAARVAVHSTDATGLRITGNDIADCSDNGILIWRSAPGEDGTIVSENRIERIGAASGGEGQYGNAVNVFRAAGVLVSNNRIRDCAFSAVRSNAGSACQIIGNRCLELGEVAIYAEFGFEGAVIADNIVEKAASGISITNFDSGGRLAICSGNIVRDLATRDHYDQRGVGISAEADTVVIGNVVENAPMAGIKLGWGPHLRDVSATGNVVRRAGIGIAVSVAEGAGSAVITDNLISQAKRGAILGMAWEKVVTDDLAKADDRRFPQLSVGRNRVT